MLKENMLSWTWKRPVQAAIQKLFKSGLSSFKDGQIVETYETDVNPHEELDEHIRQLTGITNQQLRKPLTFHRWPDMYTN